ncbi:hypothetical protein [Niabella aurantiaca]|uniref:hypothetical protein n=1 Tax=Niabella aurantiaca TaxID=379900 RepID=UPI00037539A1|nr:hypothetical protein [Niabella aurantiaca]
MSSQHKLYNHQVTPPAEAWKNIAGELEELQTLKPLGQRLQALETTPPPAVWDHIREHLEEEHSFTGVAERLQTLEVMPPAAAWDQIDAALKTDMPATKQAPVKRGAFNWSKYAVAACIAGLLAFALFHLANKPDNNTKDILAKIFDGKKDSSKPPVALQQPKTGPAALPHSEAGGSLALNDPPVKPVQIRTASGNTYKTTVEKNKAIQGRYIMLMTEDGNVVRMSKKLGNMADCIAGENASEDCNYQIEQWQKEMAKAPVAATPDNFLDILELAKSENAGL